MSSSIPNLAGYDLSPDTDLAASVYPQAWRTPLANDNTPSLGEVTQLIQSWQAGDSQALTKLVPQFYAELRKIAAFQLRTERQDHTLQTAGLVNEVFLRLSSGSEIQIQDRKHFFRLAAQVMRRILVDHARLQQADKRIGPEQKVSIEEPIAMALPIAARDVDVLDLHHALEVLAQIHPRQAQLIELRYFGGLTEDEAAEVLEVSRATLARDWKVARHWLSSRLGKSYK